MSKKQLLVHEIVKHVVVVIMLLIALKVIDRNTGLGGNIGDEKYVQLLAACSFLIAGTISGFVRLSYKDSINKDHKVSMIHVVVCDIAVCLQLFIIGVLLIVIIKCLNKIALPLELQEYPLILVSIFYASLVFYDVHDLMGLANKMQDRECHTLNVR